jgi:hypothetical protein
MIYEMSIHIFIFDHQMRHFAFCGKDYFLVMRLAPLTPRVSVLLNGGGGPTNELRKCGVYTQWNFMQP